MNFKNVASPEVASQYLSNIYQMFNEDSRSDIAWAGLSHSERATFCNLARVAQRNSSRALRDIEPIARKSILVAIARIGQVANQFQHADIPCGKYRKQGER